MPTAFVLMRCEQGTEDGIIQNLSGSDCIREVHPTIGHYDLVAEITSPNAENLHEIIEEIQKDDKVHSTKVLLRMNKPIEVT